MGCIFTLRSSSSSKRMGRNFFKIANLGSTCSNFLQGMRVVGRCGCLQERYKAPPSKIPASFLSTYTHIPELSCTHYRKWQPLFLLEIVFVTPRWNDEQSHDLYKDPCYRWSGLGSQCVPFLYFILYTSTCFLGQSFTSVDTHTLASLFSASCFIE